MPIYGATIDGKKRLVKASTLAGARNHILKDMAPVITKLDAEDVAEFMSDPTVTVEQAGAEEPELAAAEK